MPMGIAVLSVVAGRESGMDPKRILYILLAGTALLAGACGSHRGSSTSDPYRVALTSLRADVSDPKFFQDIGSLDLLTDSGVSAESLSRRISAEIDLVLEAEQWADHAEGSVASTNMGEPRPATGEYAELGEHAKLSLWLLRRASYVEQLLHRVSDRLDKGPGRPDDVLYCYLNVIYFLWGVMAFSDEGMRQLEVIYSSRGVGIDGEVALTLRETINMFGDSGSKGSPFDDADAGGRNGVHAIDLVFEKPYVEAENQGLPHRDTTVEWPYTYTWRIGHAGSELAVLYGDPDSAWSLPNPTTSLVAIADPDTRELATHEPLRLEWVSGVHDGLVLSTDGAGWILILGVTIMQREPGIILLHYSKESGLTQLDRIGGEEWRLADNVTYNSTGNTLVFRGMDWERVPISQLAVSMLSKGGIGIRLE